MSFVSSSPPSNEQAISAPFSINRLPFQASHKEKLKTKGWVCLCGCVPVCETSRSMHACMDRKSRSVSAHSFSFYLYMHVVDGITTVRRRDSSRIPRALAPAIEHRVDYLQALLDESAVEVQGSQWQERRTSSVRRRSLFGFS